MNDRVAALFRKDQIALDEVFRCALLDSDARIVIVKRKIAVLGQIAIAPRECIAAIADRIPRSIVGNARTVIEGKTITPRPACILIAVR